MAIFKVRRFKLKKPAGTYDIEIYGKLKDPSNIDILPPVIRVSRNKVYVDNNAISSSQCSSINNYGYFKDQNNNTGNKILKFLDNEGKYRFVNFNVFWEMNDDVELIGKTNKLVGSLLKAQSNKYVLGYKKTRRMKLMKENVSDEICLLLSDIYTSPFIYLYIGDGTTDIEKDWLLVTNLSTTNQVKKPKGQNNKIEIEIELPEQFTTTLL